MITCPMCKKKLSTATPVKECPSCRCDVSLLVDYVQHLREGLVQADAFTRSGELGEAVWAYLEVLEIDPDNATARRQVGKVVTAVRQFDQTAPGRRFLKRIQKQNRFRRWMARANEDGELTSWFANLGWFILFVGIFLLGYFLRDLQYKPASPTEQEKSEKKEARISFVSRLTGDRSVL